MKEQPEALSLAIDGDLRGALSALVGPEEEVPEVPEMVRAAQTGERSVLLEGAQHASLAVRREAALGLHQLGVAVRIAGWCEGAFLERARCHPWGEALLEGRPLPALGALLALSVDVEIQPRVLLVLAPLPAFHATLNALMEDDAGRVPLHLRRFAAAGLQAVEGSVRNATLQAVLLYGESALDVDAERLVLIAALDPDPEVRRQAARLHPRPEVLRRVRALETSDGTRDALAQTLVHDPCSKEARGHGLAALATQHPGLARELAGALLQDADPGLALESARLLAPTTPASEVHGAVQRGIDLLGYHDWAQRRVGVALLAGLPLAGDLREEVVELLEGVRAHDADPEVQREARLALEALCED